MWLKLRVKSRHYSRESCKTDLSFEPLNFLDNFRLPFCGFYWRSFLEIWDINEVETCRLKRVDLLPQLELWRLSRGICNAGDAVEFRQNPSLSKIHSITFKHAYQVDPQVVSSINHSSIAWTEWNIKIVFNLNATAISFVIKLQVIIEADKTWWLICLIFAFICQYKQKKYY